MVCVCLPIPGFRVEHYAQQQKPYSCSLKLQWAMCSVFVYTVHEQVHTLYVAQSIRTKEFYENGVEKSTSERNGNTVCFCFDIIFEKDDATWAVYVLWFRLHLCLSCVFFCLGPSFFSRWFFPVLFPNFSFLSWFSLQTKDIVMNKKK